MYQMYLIYVGKTTYLMWIIHKRTLGTNRPEFVEIGINNKKNDWSLCSNLMAFLARKATEWVVSWCILCCGTSLAMRPCFVDLRTTPSHSSFKSLYFNFNFFRVLFIPLNFFFLYNWKKNHKTKWTWVEDLSSFLS